MLAKCDYVGKTNTYRYNTLKHDHDITEWNYRLSGTEWRNTPTLMKGSTIFVSHDVIQRCLTPDGRRARSSSFDDIPPFIFKYIQETRNYDAICSRASLQSFDDGVLKHTKPLPAALVKSCRRSIIEHIYI